MKKQNHSTLNIRIIACKKPNFRNSDFIKISLFACCFILFSTLFSCDKLQKEDTPVCKDCYQMKFKNSVAVDTLKSQRLCGGDVVVWENIPDSNSTVDTTVIQFFCK